jgi:hypothetical protein
MLYPLDSIHMHAYFLTISTFLTDQMQHDAMYGYGIRRRRFHLYSLLKRQ